MKPTRAALGSAIFFLAAPGTVAGLIPLWITGWRFGDDASLGYMIAGGVLVLASLAVLIECFIRFARHLGTPAPIAPTPTLIVSGLYRHVRNPMYLAVLGLVFGQMFIFAHAALLAYAVALALIFHGFVYFYEEPTLRVTFGEAYDAYQAAVPRWLPRLSPWRVEAA